MGAADAAFVTWYDFLRHDPRDPGWPARDRFVLSAGHMSMLLYGLLHLSGYDLPLEELGAFRQWGSRTPGHPEAGLTPGVEVTGGPLGNGFAHAVGMALASKMAGARFADERGALVDSRVYVLASDGDIMEGVCGEAASLAGHLELGNLVCIWDDNEITIDGSTDLAFSEDVLARFRSYGFHTQSVDGHDRDALRDALSRAVQDPSAPWLIDSRTRIAYGSPAKQGTSDSHGAPLGPDEVRATKKVYGWPEDSSFLVPEDVRGAFASRNERIREQRRTWEARVRAYRESDPEKARAWDDFWHRRVPGDLLETTVAALADAGPLPTRKHSYGALQAVAGRVEALVGGSADLTGSNSVGIAGAASIVPSSVPDPARPDPSFAGRNIHFGVREHAMGAVVNGMALFGGFRPYAATYLVFSDYLRPALRLAALMEAPVTYVFSHDSFRVGEDGPTHQPVEQLWALRAIPELVVFRPADAVEAAAAWSFAASLVSGPLAIVVSRQKVAEVERPADLEPRDVLKGAYVLRDPDDRRLVIVATGSEVPLAVEAARLLAPVGLAARVVSMPSVELFLEQPSSYRDAVLPPALPVVTLEAGTTTGWYRFTGADGLTIGLDRFGASAPFGVLEQKFGFTPEAVAEHVRRWWGARGKD
jgi:transketolase